MRKGLALILTGAMVMSLAACGGSSKTTAQTPSQTAAAGSLDEKEKKSASAPDETKKVQAKSAPASDGKKRDIAVCVLENDYEHGWYKAVLAYAQEEADRLNADTTVNAKYSVSVYAAADVDEQRQQIEDLLANRETLGGIVILPFYNGLVYDLEDIVSADVPLVQFSMILSSKKIDEKVISNVIGDDEGVGYATAERFIADGLTKDDYVYEIDNDGTTEQALRSKGFRKYLTEQGWTEDDINKVVVKSDKKGSGKELFESWFGSAQCDPAKNNWIFAHDESIALEIMKSLNGSELDANKKTEFLKTLRGLGSCGGRAELYAVLKDKHKTLPRPETYDLFTVTYDPVMIKEAIGVMMDYLDGKTTEQLHIIPVSVVDKDNVEEFRAYDTYDDEKQ